MFRDTSPTSDESEGAANLAGRDLPTRNRSEGYVIECDGNNAVISANMPTDGSVSPDYWAVGSLITIRSDKVRTVGMLYRVETADDAWQTEAANTIHIHVELVGEIREGKNGEPMFSGGLSAYPHLGSVAHRIRNDDLEAIFANSDPSAVRAGVLSQNTEIPAMISVDSMISRHFAVVGTTGVGKSTTVSLLVRKIVQARPDLGILVLDPHNEFASAFPDISVSIDDTTLDLPFWLFKLEEFVEVLFRGRPADPEEVDILRDLIPEARQRFRGDTPANGVRKQTRSASMTADTPVPYRIADLLKLIDDRMGQLDSRDYRSKLKSIASRIDAAVHDPRYRFMFAHRTITDNLASVLSHIYRVPANDKPVCILQLNGIPSEVVNAVVSVLCRVAFELSVWSQARIKTLVLCEEAHRYIPADVEAGFGPTRASIARIAKEGRKYGVSLGIITQRPSELDATILSQCNTMFAMRLGNDADQEIMRSAITGASRSYINFLASLANREAIAFGQGVNTPMRMLMEYVPAAELPGNHLDDTPGQSDDAKPDIASIIQTIREPAREHADSDGSDLDAQVQRAGEQRPSIHAGPAPTPDTSEMFTYDGPLRRQPGTAPKEPKVDIRRKPEPAASTGSATSDVINRFRR